MTDDDAVENCRRAAAAAKAHLLAKYPPGTEVEFVPAGTAVGPVIGEIVGVGFGMDDGEPHINVRWEQSYLGEAVAIETGLPPGRFRVIDEGAAPAPESGELGS